MERKEERVMARQSIFKFNERVTTEAKDATYEFRGPVISVRNLEKKFGEHEVLKDISFDLFEGDVVCIIGSSGSGKSTLLSADTECVCDIWKGTGDRGFWKKIR